MWHEHCIFFFYGVTQYGMPSVFKMLFLFWLVVMCSLSSVEEIDVCAELLADDVWEAKDNKTVFLIVGMDSADQLYL